MGHLPSRWREGVGEGLFDRRHDTVDILENVIVPEAKDAKTMCREERIPCGFRLAS